MPRRERVETDAARIVSSPANRLGLTTEKTMKRMLVRTLAALLLAAALGVGAQSSPAGADPAFTQLAEHALSPRFNVNGCLFRARYGNFGVTPYAQMRIYNPASCNPSGVTLGYHDGTEVLNVTANFWDGFTTGTDGCGAYREVQATGPAGTDAQWVPTSVPEDPNNPDWFDGWRFFSSDGQGTLPVNSYC